MQVEVSGGIRDDRSLEAALESGASRINLGTAALENPEWAADVIGRYGDVIAVGLDVRGTTLAARGLDPGGRRPLDGARATRRGRLQPLRRHRRHEGRNPEGAEPRAPARDHLAHDRSRSSPRAASRASTTSPRCATSCRSAWRARSWARPCTRVRSPSPRRWMSPDTDPHDHHHAGDSAGVPWEGRRFESNAHSGDDGSADPALLAALTVLPRRRRRPGRRHRGVSRGAPADPADRREGRRGRAARTV